MSDYNHKDIEGKWQKEWVKNNIYQSTEDASKPKQYVLDMFPYPSGVGLHVGHPKGYIATDIFSRFKRMNGFSVLHPMGWDAFGLPAENYALKNKLHPRISVEKNIARYKEQLSVIGLDYDWSREIDTTDPKYYKWTQWTFIQMYKKGLVYQSNEPINWCPSCKTGLANEDLDGDKCERCGTLIEQKKLPQWVIKITDYADRLLQDLDELDWPESIKTSQRNWIGRSVGAKLSFKIHTDSSDVKKTIDVFTTRPDTLFGVTYLVLAPEHPLIHSLEEDIENIDEVRTYKKKVEEKTEIDRTAEGKEKTGVELKGISAIHPATGESIPVWIADYVLVKYGTGAVMAVPAHDQRDFEFATIFNLPIKQVIAPAFTDPEHLPQEGKEWSSRKMIHAIVLHPTEDKMIQIQWKQFPWKTFITGGVEDGESYEDAVNREVVEETGYTNIASVTPLGWQMSAKFYADHKDVNRDAQTRAFVVELKNLDQTELSDEEKQKHEVVWVSKDAFETYNPVGELPEIVANLAKGPHSYAGEGILINSEKYDGLSSGDARTKITNEFGESCVTYKLHDWVFSRQRYWGEPIPLIHCKACGVVPVPEAELPVVLPDVSSYEPTGTGESPLSAIYEWVNTSCPKCGDAGRRETNTMPQWAGSSWYYLRYMDPTNTSEIVSSQKENYWAPVDMYVGGAEHATRHLIYARFWHKFLFDQNVVSTDEPFKRLQHVGLIMGEDGRKMSKRFGNVVNPDEIVDRLGADTLRVYEMFIGPFSQSIAWNQNGTVGSRRFLERVWRLQGKVSDSGISIDSSLHKAIKKITDGINSFSFNTCISTLMILVNEFDSHDTIKKDEYQIFIKLLAPFAPHISEEIWHILGNSNFIHQQQWPEYDSNKAQDASYTIPVQVNGKVRSSITVSTDSTEQEIIEKALEEDNVQHWINGKEIKRTIYVKGKIINVVL